LQLQVLSGENELAIVPIEDAISGGRIFIARLEHEIDHNRITIIKQDENLRYATVVYDKNEDPSY
jgi:hypothetical protein